MAGPWHLLGYATHLKKNKKKKKAWAHVRESSCWMPLPHGCRLKRTKRKMVLITAPTHHPRWGHYLITKQRKGRKRNRWCHFKSLPTPQAQTPTPRPPFFCFSDHIAPWYCELQEVSNSYMWGLRRLWVIEIRGKRHHQLHWTDKLNANTRGFHAKILAFSR